MNWLIDLIKRLLFLKSEPIDMPKQRLIKPEPVVENKPKYEWSTPGRTCNSCRVIMDEYNLNWEQKAILCACIYQESQFFIRAIGRLNENGTQDFGLCQYNNGKNKQGKAYWIGKGATFKDVDEVLNDPEKNIRVMIKEFQRYGSPKWWSSYTTGAYRKHLKYFATKKSLEKFYKTLA